MKPTAKDYDDSIVVVKDGPSGYEMLYFNRLMGSSKIGPRLGRKNGLPNLPTKAENWSEAIELRGKWQAWLDETQIISQRKGQKQK